MARRSGMPEQQARRALIGELLSTANVQSMGKVEIDIPRDRNGDFEPQLIRKNQTSISQDMENKIISMYAKGMSTSDIEAHIRDIYGLKADLYDQCDRGIQPSD